MSSKQERLDAIHARYTAEVMARYPMTETLLTWAPVAHNAKASSPGNYVMIEMEPGLWWDGEMELEDGDSLYTLAEIKLAYERRYRWELCPDLEEQLFRELYSCK